MINLRTDHTTDSHVEKNLPPVHPARSCARVLLSSVFGPYGQDDEYGSRRLNPMELYHNQVTRTQGAFSLRMFHRSWGLMLIQANIEAPCVVLDFPDLDRFIEEIRDSSIRRDRHYFDHPEHAEGQKDVRIDPAISAGCSDRHRRAHCQRSGPGRAHRRRLHSQGRRGAVVPAFFGRGCKPAHTPSHDHFGFWHPKRRRIGARSGPAKSRPRSFPRWVVRWGAIFAPLRRCSAEKAIACISTKRATNCST